MRLSRMESTRSLGFYLSLYGAVLVMLVLLHGGPFASQGAAVLAEFGMLYTMLGIVFVMQGNITRREWIA